MRGYFQDHTSSWVMKTLLFELAKVHDSRKKHQGKSGIYRDITLHEVGFVMSKMMGHVYKSRYLHITKARSRDDAEDENVYSHNIQTFPSPFDDLFVSTKDLRSRG
jgi:hypothetical protein